MKALFLRIYNTPNYARAIRWGKLVSITGSAQVLVQATGLVSGILVIRMLPTQEYALYTLANTMLASLTILADGGISTGVMALGGKVWQDPKKLGTVLATGFHIRAKFALAGLLFAAPVLLYLLLHHGASWLMSVLIILSLVPAFFAVLTGDLLEIAPKLRQDILPLQKIQVASNTGRLLMIMLTVFVFPWAFVAVLAAGLPQVWANIRLRKISAGYADRNQEQDPLLRKQIITFVKRILPYSIYYCLSGQITVWLLSVFGSTKSVAQIGALGRLAIVLNIFTVLFATLITPRFARLPGNSVVLLSHYIRIQAGLLILSCCILLSVLLFPSEVLWILGHGYSDLESELLLSMAGSCAGIIAGASFALYTSRGWVINPALAIPINMITITAAAMLLDISTLQGILLLNIIVALVQVIMNVVYSLFKILQVKNLGEPPADEHNIPV